MLKNCIKIFVLIGVIALISKGWVTYTRSFRLDKILPTSSFEKTESNNESFEKLSKILDQKFRFFNKGRHTFVFISEDGNFVLKFFRFHRYSLPFTYQTCNFLPFIKNISEKSQKELNISYQETMQSYQLVYDQLPNETALVYAHLSKTNNLFKKITIIDKFKVPHKIDLDNYGFIIQKKAKSFKKELLRLKNDNKAVESLLISFFDNLKNIYKKNIINDDRHILNNLGVIDNKVVELDLGRFAKKELSDDFVLKSEAKNYTFYLKKWLKKNIPYAEYIVDKQLNILFCENY